MSEVTQYTSELLIKLQVLLDRGVTLQLFIVGDDLDYKSHSLVLENFTRKGEARLTVEILDRDLGVLCLSVVYHVIDFLRI